MGIIFQGVFHAASPYARIEVTTLPWDDRYWNGYNEVTMRLAHCEYNAESGTKQYQIRPIAMESKFAKSIGNCATGKQVQIKRYIRNG